MSIHTVTFNVDGVKEQLPSETNFNTPSDVLLRERFARKSDSFSWEKKPLQPSMYIEAVAKGKPGREVQCNGFLEACTLAFGNHYKLELWVDHIKLVICQAFAIHVKEHSEEFRGMLVNHDGQKTIQVRRDDFVKGQANPWPEVFEAFAEGIRSDIKDPLLIEKIQKPSQTTTDTTMAAINVAILDTFSKYYKYDLCTLCGIPSITLKGSVEDWIALKDMVNYMGKYNFRWFTDKMEQILDEFIMAARGHPNVEFWQEFVKIRGGSGGPYYDGHIKYFFPYLENYRGSYHQNGFTSSIVSSSVPGGFTSVPFEWHYFDKLFHMKFLAGFFAITLSDNGSVMPDILWAIEDVDRSKINYDIPSNIMACYKSKTIYEPAGVHYNNPQGGVICDFCRKHVYDKAMGHDDQDLCFDCVKKIDDILALAK